MSRVLRVMLLALALLLIPVPTVMAAGSSQIQLDVNFTGIYPSQDGQGILVQDVYDFNNLDSKPYAGDQLIDPSGNKKNGFLVPLPSGFSLGHDLKGLQTGEYAAVSEGIQVYKALQPGKTEIEIYYNLKVTPPAAFSKKIPFSTKELVIDTPKKDFSLSSDLVQSAGSVNDQGVEYARYYGKEIGAGSILNLKLDKGTNTTGAVKDNRVSAGYTPAMHPEGHTRLFMSEPLVYTNPHLWAAYLFIMIGLGIAALIVWVRQRGKVNLEEDDLDEEDEDLFLRLKTKQDALLQRIKALDDEYKAGGMNEEKYRKTREKYKQLLVRVKIQLKELT